MKRRDDEGAARLASGRTAEACCPTGSEPEPGPLTDQASDEALADLARALAHPARVRILRLLVARGTCICGELVEELPLAQSTVSQHLKVLKEAGLIQGEVDGPRTCYCVDPAGMRRLRLLVAAL